MEELSSLGFSYHLVKYFDGPNDGLIGTESFGWSDNFTLPAAQKEKGL